MTYKKKGTYKAFLFCFNGDIYNKIVFYESF